MLQATCAPRARGRIPLYPEHILRDLELGFEDGDGKSERARIHALGQGLEESWNNCIGRLWMELCPPLITATPSGERHVNHLCSIQSSLSVLGPDYPGNIFKLDETRISLRLVTYNRELLVSMRRRLQFDDFLGYW